MLRKLITALASLIIVTGCADASVHVGGRGPGHLVRSSNSGFVGTPGVLPSITYDTSIGLGVDTNGRTDLTPRVGASKFYVRTSTGSDSNTCTQAQSPSTPKATIKSAEACVTDGAGDHVLIAQGETYPSGFAYIGDKGGFSAQYPVVYQSYDPADPTNQAKWGTATGSQRPVIDSSAVDSQSGGFIQGTGTAKQYRAIRGLEFNPGNIANVFLSTLRSNAGGTPDYFLWENDVVAYTELDFNFSQASARGTHIVLRNSAFYGAWANSLSLHAQCIYGSMAEITIEDSIFWHCGWKTTAARSDDPTLGGPTQFNHPIYIGVDTRNTIVRRSVFIDNDADGGVLKAGGIYNYNLSINNPIGMEFEAPDTYTAGDSITNSDFFTPLGVGEEAAFNAVIGGGAMTTSATDWGLRAANSLPGSAIHHNVLARSSAQAAYALMIDARLDVYPGTASGLPSYADFYNNTSYLWSTSGNTKGLGLNNTVDPTLMHYTFNNNVWDDPASGTNVNNGGVSFPTAHTVGTLMTALGYADLPTAQADWIAHPEQHKWRTGWSLMATGYGITSPPLTDLVANISVTAGVPTTSQFLKMLDGSSLSVTGLPASITYSINCQCWHYDGTGTASTGTATATETNGVSTHNTSIPWAIYARPVLSSVTVTPGSTSASATFSTNTGNGNAFWIATTSTTTPTWEFVRAGIDASTSTATAWGKVAITATGAQSIPSITGLTAGTGYNLYLAQLDANGIGNPSLVSATAFTTTGGGSPTQWSAANSSANWTISGTGNTTATHTTGAFWDIVVANNAKTSGDFTVTIPTFTALVQVGLGNASLAGTTVNNHLSVDANAVAYEAWTGNVYVGGSLFATWSPPAWADGDSIKVANASGMVTFYRCTPSCTSLGTVNATALGTSLTPAAATAGNGQVLTGNFTNY
jgi:hypothetical protein